MATQEKPRLFTFTQPQHDAAVYFLHHRPDIALTEIQRYQLEQIVNGHVGLCDRAAAWRGMALLRRLHDRIGALLHPDLLEYPRGANPDEPNEEDLDIEELAELADARYAEQYGGA